MNMLNALPEYSPVLQYISDNINQPVQVLGQWNSYGLGSLQYPEKSITTHNLGKATLDGGVYVLNAWEDYSQYVGSTYNHYSRLTSHMMKFKQDWGPALDLTDKYQWASVNGGLRAWNWFEVYRTFNYPASVAGQARLAYSSHLPGPLLQEPLTGVRGRRATLTLYRPSPYIH